VTRSNMENHCATVCPMKPITCPFHHVSCPTSMPQVCNMITTAWSILSSSISQCWLIQTEFTHQQSFLLQLEMHDHVSILISILCLKLHKISTWKISWCW
jgi:hypothetical protein